MFQERKGDHHIPYCDRLTNQQNRINFKPVNKIERKADIDLFKERNKPFWESSQDNGCWLLRFKRKAELKEINLKQEKIMVPKFRCNLIKYI